MGMIEPRSGAAAAVVGSALYVCGGMGPKNPCSVERYNTEIGVWEAVPPMLAARCYAAATASASKLWVFGGSHGHQHLDSGEELDPVTGVWTALPLMSEKRMAPAAAFAPL